MDTKTPPTESQRYNAPFHSSLRASRRQSARIIVPFLIQSINPDSVLDVSSTSDEWLAEFRKHGLTDLLGLEPGSLSSAFEEGSEQPAHTDRRFDLALCLDGAQGLDGEHASSLVKELTRLAPVVVFCGDTPLQREDRHPNEPWQSHWTRLFEAQGYRSFFALRHSLWEKEDVELAYRQNIICFCARDHTALIGRLTEVERDANPAIDVVHPDHHLQVSGDLAKWRRSSEQLERRVRGTAAEIYGLKSEVDRLRTELRRVNNYAPLRVYRSLRRAATGKRRTKTAEPQVAQERERAPAMTNVAKLIEDCPHFHAWPDGKSANWAVPPNVLRFICDQVKPGMHTLETGAGQTTVAFALAGAQHITITPDQGQIERIRDYLRQSGIENNVSFVQASSDAVLPTGEGIPPRLDFVFIDGAHRFPFPIIDWYYTADRVPVGGLVAVDDCRMPSVRILHDFLAGEDDWELVQLIHVTAFFRRVRDTVNQWDWADQRINKPHLDMVARKSAPDPKDDPITRFLRKLI